jgi:hypothetical protein
MEPDLSLLPERHLKEVKCFLLTDGYFSKHCRGVVSISG